MPFITFLLLFPMASESVTQYTDVEELNETGITLMEVYDSYDNNQYRNENPIVVSFIKGRICPEIIPAPPEKKLHVLYNFPTRARFGNRVNRMYLSSIPRVDWQDDSPSLYTLIMINPDVPKKNMTFKKWHPWVVGNIPGRRNIFFGNTLYSYKISQRPRFIGNQRHVFLLYRQQKGRINFDPEDYHKPATLPKFNLMKFVFKYDLGNPEFGNFFKSFD